MQVVFAVIRDPADVTLLFAAHLCTRYIRNIRYARRRHPRVCVSFAGLKYKAALPLSLSLRPLTD
ncbi:hypothetical protein PPN31114_01360 [Pandoraea pneumonica]|jgi:hypothetical protein|uniref:Uncharacterized protein n=1 Tax=Pandoraea pneumonica TaxID=2508299 RepID=A0A5E4TFD6_9BURK|nr:hypothetical protein PPN31114_01360 [Pandoraea pneumonica]